MTHPVCAYLASSDWAPFTLATSATETLARRYDCDLADAADQMAIGVIQLIACISQTHAPQRLMRVRRYIDEQIEAWAAVPVRTGSYQGGKSPTRP